MKKLVIIIASILIPLFIYSFGYSEIRVVSVKGQVAYKTKHQWSALKNGQTLSEGTKISTGVRSTAIIMIDDHKVSIRQLTMMKIVRNKKTGTSHDTNIGLKYGSINAKVDKLKRLKTRFKISTPVATSSVRGTEQNVTYGAKSGMIVIAISGVIIAGTPEQVAKIISGNSVFQQKLGDVKPENILAKLQDLSFVKINDVNVTGDEKVTIIQFADDIFDSTDLLNSYNDLLSDIRGSATVNLKLQWGGK